MLSNILNTLIAMVWILITTKFTVALYNRRVFLSAKPAKNKSKNQILEGAKITFILDLANVCNSLILILIETITQKIIIGITIAFARSLYYYFDITKKKWKKSIKP